MGHPNPSFFCCFYRKLLWRAHHQDIALEALFACPWLHHRQLGGADHMLNDFTQV
jgi:hypothetical protein